MDENRLGGRLALQTVGRAMRYSLRFKWELAVKGLTQATSIFWILVLPLTGKAIVDFVVLRETVPISDANVPFFFLPFLEMVAGLEAFDTAIFLGIAFIFMLVLVGAYGTDGAQRNSSVAWLAEGEDIATRSENAANNMHSLVSGLFGLFESLWHIRVAHRLNHMLRSDIFQCFKAHPLTDFQDRSIGDVVYRAMYDTPQISNIIFNLWVGPITSAINLITTILVMFVIFRNEPVVVWGAILVGPLNFFLVLYFAKLARKYGTLAREAGAQTTAVIEEGMTNVLAVQGLSDTDVYTERFAKVSYFSFARYRQVVLVSICGSFTTFVIGANMVYIVFYFLAGPFINEVYSPGDWFVIWGYFGAIAASATWLGRLWLTLQEGIAGMHRVFNILDRDQEYVERLVSEEQTPSMEIREGLRLEDVSYEYPDGTPALQNINFEAKIGEMIALAGPTGAGKTTLVYLLPGLLLPTRGEYAVDGQHVPEDQIRALRSNVAFVFQETSIFDDSIASNISMGRRGATEDEIREAARIAGIADFIDSLPEGYQSNLGRSGAKLSVGQKQRIAIARALVSNKPILILDEPTAALDPQTENQLVTNLLNARTGRIVVVVAHRLSTIRAADRIYFMDEGKIIESGSHSELIEQQGTYASFVNLQTS